MHPHLKIFWPKNSWGIMRYLCGCRNQLFFNFSKYLRNYKEYLKLQGRFQIILSTIFYTKSSMKPSCLESSLTCNIFSKSWFLFSDKISYSKTWWRHSLLLLHWQKTNKISEAARLISHFQKMSSVTYTFEEFCLKFPEHLFCRTHFIGCFLKLYYS